VVTRLIYEAADNYETESRVVKYFTQIDEVLEVLYRGKVSCMSCARYREQNI
jgi:hypothetical protein